MTKRYNMVQGTAAKELEDIYKDLVAGGAPDCTGMERLSAYIDQLQEDEAMVPPPDNSLNNKMAGILTEVIQLYNKRVAEVTQVFDEDIPVLDRPARNADLAVLAMALASCQQGMDEKGQIGSTYHWSDVAVMQASGEMSARFDHFMEFVHDNTPAD